MSSTVVASPETAEIVIERTVGGPRELVWRCYTEPHHMVRFWGPKGSTTPVCEVDLRVGGVWRTVMRFASGNEYGYDSVYLEIEAPRRLVWRDAPRGYVSGTALPPVEILTTLELEAVGERTHMRITARFNSIAARDQAVRQGFAKVIAESGERFDDYVTTLSPIQG